MTWTFEHVKPETLRPAPWRATHMLRPDLKILTRSIKAWGLFPTAIIVRHDLTIIDGFHRWLCVTTDKELKSDITTLPIVRSRKEDDSEIEAMVMHVALNLTNGHLVAKRLSDLIKKIMRSGDYTEEDLCERFNMNVDDMDLLLDGTLLKVKKIAEHKYSNAWVPVEAENPTRDTTTHMSIERPPNADR